MTRPRGLRRDARTVLAAVLMSVAFVVGLLAWGGRLPGGGGYRVRAIVPSAANLASGARVTMAGVEVGRVTKVQRHGVGAVVELDVTKKWLTPVPVDSRVRIRSRTPAGENYIALSPGTSAKKLPSGGELAAGQADQFVDLDQILSILQGTTQQLTRELAQAVAEGLEGRGTSFNGVLASASDSVDSGASIVDVLARDRRQVSQLTQQLGDVAAAVGQRQDDVATVAGRGVIAFRAIARQDTALRKTLDTLPPTLASLKDATTALRAT
ncbi:MAG: hypothetical protein JWO02_3498, partial [Solirubrobacterales bacterium]|nr:hypothetical protein [Solirubrobacterales bacterium]